MNEHDTLSTDVDITGDEPEPRPARQAISLRHLRLLGNHSRNAPKPARQEAPHQAIDDGSDDPWKPATATSRPAWWLVIRIALLVVLGILALVGLLTVLHGVSGRDAAAPVTTGESAATEYDARAIAERYTESYFTWDEKNPEARRSALSLDVEQTTSGTTAASPGWDGHGRQSAGAARATEIHWSDAEAPTKGTPTTGTVTVVFRRVGYTADGTPEPAQWWSALVPVTVSEGRVMVSGAPGLMPVEPSQTASVGREPDGDGEVQTATRDYAKTFFAAYASQADVSAVAAPGSDIRGMAGAVELEKVEGWTVLPGTNEETRSGHARITWKTGSATYINEYTVELTRTKAGGNEKWLISSINGIS